ncbi:Necrosis inducing protein NPP1 type [Phytophthora nicotianae]|uniref:Necrosis inducing protein NPP1 type n=1 Tax=Phytophthora nicotianae TaxID=4792 RepID=A0A0W8D2Z9_PHYNI|nr:Necrosis inducing protein NPP1 type [Phytophthora nicotianae]
MNFSTAWSSNAVAICQACGISAIKRIERATRYLVRYTATKPEAVEALKQALLRHECDRMTQQVYEEPLTSFWHGKTVQPVRKIPIMERGIDALKEINEEIGLGFDDWDLQYYLNLFKEKLKRNPTDVECFDMGQSNSEHSRHWFFGGKIVVDGKEMPQTLFQMVKNTLTENAKKNSVIAFHDNSSVIKGANIVTLGPVNPGEPSAVQERTLDSHLLLTAETHNFPSGVAPFPGAETGTGGRIRDVQATGRGANVVAGVSAYSVGNLNLEGYKLPWEDEKLEYPSNLAHPRDILIQASNGASDYGNKFGEPVVTGFARSFGMVLPNGERREYIKPIMFSAGLGQLDGRHCTKGEPEIQMWVVKIGGPCYRIGMGGGAASSRIQDTKTADLDFNAVQRGDAEMECKLNKVIRACCDLGEKNPIVSIHDQGAGGNGNVLKEIVEVSNSKPGDANRGGARYEVRNILVGDDTLSVLEIWGAEYQENDALLLRPEHVELFDKICKRKALEEETKTSAQPRFVHNESGRHESRFVSVQIQESNAVMLRGMAGSSLGVWVSHGEGRAHFTHPKIQEKYVASGAAAIRYVDDSNVPTEEYPFNPNGSPQGIAGLVSSDGRHMCLMPHPERCFLKYQWPYMPAEFEAHPVSPWMQIFQNAKSFCEGQ